MHFNVITFIHLQLQLNSTVLQLATKFPVTGVWEGRKDRCTCMTQGGKNAQDKHMSGTHWEFCYQVLGHIFHMVHKLTVQVELVDFDILWFNYCEGSLRFL